MKNANDHLQTILGAKDFEIANLRAICEQQAAVIEEQKKNIDALNNGHLPKK